jgi:hypothetical protein
MDRVPAENNLVVGSDSYLTGDDNSTTGTLSIVCDNADNDEASSMSSSGTSSSESENSYLSTSEVVPSSVVVPTTINAMVADHAYSDDSDDDSFAPKLHQMMAAAAAAYAWQKKKYAKPKRYKRRNYVRLDWDQYWEESLNDKYECIVHRSPSW